MDLRKRRSQEKLQLALAHHLQNKTIDEITIRELTETAGVSRQTFYSNFNSKQSILLSRIESLFDRSRINFEHLVKRHDLSQEEVIAYGIKHLLEECSREKAMMRAAFTGQAGIQCLSLLKAFFDNIIAEQILYQFNIDQHSQDKDTLTDFYAGALIGTIQGWLLNGAGDKDVNAVAAQIAQLIPKGLGSFVDGY